MRWCVFLEIFQRETVENRENLALPRHVPTRHVSSNHCLLPKHPSIKRFQLTLILGMA